MVGSFSVIKLESQMNQETFLGFSLVLGYYASSEDSMISCI